MSTRGPRTMTQDEVEAYKRAMLEKYEAQRLENEAIRKRQDAEKSAKADAERRKKEAEDAQRSSERATEVAKKKSEEDARRALELHRKQQEEEAAQRMVARAASTTSTSRPANALAVPGMAAGKMPMSARGPSTSNPPVPAAPSSARRGLPVVDDLYLQAAALAEGRPEPHDVVRGSQDQSRPQGEMAFDPAIQLELETIQSLIESASSTELLISSVPFEAELESEEDRALARKLAEEEAARKRKEEEERKKREQEAEQMAKQLNFNFTIAAQPVAPPPKKEAAIDADFDAMLANLQQATADLEF